MVSVIILSSAAFIDRNRPACGPEQGPIIFVVREPLPAFLPTSTTAGRQRSRGLNGNMRRSIRSRKTGGIDVLVVLVARPSGAVPGLPGGLSGSRAHGR